MDITYKIMDYFVRRAVELSENIAICPMGEYGLLSKQILNWRYGVKERFRVDNYMKKYNKDIVGVDDLKEIDVENLVIILATINKEVNHELVNHFLMLNKDIRVINILDPIIFEKDDYSAYIKRVRELLTVRGVSDGGDFIRVGRNYDGGYIMLNDFTDSMHAYSFGIGDDVSWEEHISANGVEVFMYDHTIDNLPKEVKGGIFWKTGISVKDDFDNKKLSLKTILEQNSDDKKDNLILKMDVEGAEWEVLEEMPFEILSKFVQMTFEFHGLLDLKKQDQILNILSKLNETHQVIWVHANNCGHAYTANGLILPNLLEVTYISRTKYKFYNYDIYNLPMELDMPNLSDRNEIILGDFSDSMRMKDV